MHQNFNISVVPEPAADEQITLKKDSIIAKVVRYTGKQGDFIVNVIPSLNVSGYGRTEEEAFDSIKENMATFFNDLFSLTEVQRHKELRNLGWSANQLLKYRLSFMYIDEAGILKNFDNPEQVTKSTLQAA